MTNEQFLALLYLIFFAVILIMSPFIFYVFTIFFCFIKDRFTGNYPLVKDFISGKDVVKVTGSPSMSYSIHHDGKNYGFDHIQFFEYTKEPASLFVTKTNKVSFSGEQTALVANLLEKECVRTTKRKEREFLKNLTKSPLQDDDDLLD